MTAIKDIEPLKTGYTPENIFDRETETEQLQKGLQQLQNVHVHGPKGTGKTLVTEKSLEALDIKTSYISCDQYDTQYKALKQITSELTRENISSGHHTSELQRRIQKQVEAVQTLIILDELDFLLLNDGDDLLYFLSRIKADLGLILVTANHRELRNQLEERTFSTLQPKRIGFEPFSGEEIYKILADRARRSMKPRSLRREALTYITSSTQNLEAALTWLRVSAQQAEDTVTEDVVQQLTEEASQQYISQQLQSFTHHHRLLYQAIEKVGSEQETIQTGEVYQRYKHLCSTYDESPLSDRRISDYIKQLEQLNLINSKYHYGGEKGKTREITVETVFNR